MAADEEASLVSKLEELAKSSDSTCGGTIPGVDNVDIIYKKQTGEWSAKPLSLPDGQTEECVQDFVESCSPASSGSENELRELKPDSFYSNFELANTTIFDSIATVMSIDLPIRAELCKLNVYSKGGHFKTHVDTPCSEDMFGSLVVCLQSDFKGGQLVTRHQGRQTTFDWSSSVQTHWAALLSDVEHEVLPVTAGYRITLTYNLYHLYSSPTAGPALLDVTTNPLYKELLSALKNPQFMRGGGTLGFYCQQRYTTNFSTDLEKFRSNLKGEDAILYSVAKALQLSISLKPLLYRKLEEKELELEDVFDGSSEEEKGCYFLHEFVYYQGGGDEDSISDLVKAVKKEFSDPERVSGIRWCQDPQVFQPVFVSYIRVDDRMDEFIMAMYVIYQCPAFLVEIPKFTSERGAVLTEISNID